MTLPASMAAKLRRLIPMLASSHDGEVIATRNAIARELAAGQRDLHDLAAAIAVTSEPVAPVRCKPSPSFGDLARACRDLDRGRLTPRERAFVADMVRRGFTFRPSPRQAAWLADILSRLEGRAAA